MMVKTYSDFIEVVDRWYSIFDTVGRGLLNDEGILVFNTWREVRRSTYYASSAEELLKNGLIVCKDLDHSLDGAVIRRCKIALKKIIEMEK